MTERSSPPFTEVAMSSLALIVAGGIYLSAHLPQHVPLDPAIGLLVASAAAVPQPGVADARPGLCLGALFRGRQVVAACLPIHRGIIEYVFCATSQRRRTCRAHALAARLRGSGTDADRLHRRTVRHVRESGAGGADTLKSAGPARCPELPRPWRPGIAPPRG